jgi:hypothetical protein
MVVLWSLSVGWLIFLLHGRTQNLASFSGMSNNSQYYSGIIVRIGPTAFIAMIADLQSLYISLPNFANMRTILLSLLTSHGNEEIEHVKLWAIHNKLLDAVLISKFLFALPAFSGFLCASDLSRF